MQGTKRSTMTFFPASSPLGFRSATAFSSAFTRGHGSRLLTLRLHFVHRSAPACTALSTVIGIMERFASQLPNRRFHHPPDQCLLARCLVTSDQDRKLVTAFRSPVTTAPFEATIAGSTFPACYFAPLPPAHATRSDFDSAPPPVCGERRWFHCLSPVAAPSCGTSGCLCDLHSSSGLLHP
jgi:hypothetical protein